MAGRLVVLVAVAAALAVASVAAAADDVQPPDGAVGGVQSQAAGVLHLSVLATDGGVGLDRASAALDGAPVAEAAYGNGECCPAVGTVTLDVDTTAVADGAHVLTVVVADAAGNAKTLVDQTITVLNTPPKNRPTVSMMGDTARAISNAEWY